MSKIATDKNIKTVRKICLASSTLFNLTSCLNNWTAPIATALGCVVTWSDELSASLSDEYDAAIMDALELTKKRTSSPSQLKIIDELIGTSVTPENMEDLIKKTDSFQTQYCTDNEAKNILGIFEICFRECVPKYELLSRYYILSTGVVSLEQLEKIYEAMKSEQESIMEVKADTADIKHKLYKFEDFFKKCLYELAFALISVAAFLFLGIFLTLTYASSWHLAALICYIIASVLTQVIENATFFEYETRQIYRFIPLIMFVLLSSACFMLVITSTERMSSVDHEFAIFAFAIGSLVGGIIRLIWENRQRPSI